LTDIYYSANIGRLKLILLNQSMEEKDKSNTEMIYHFIIIFVISLVAGYWLKTSLKPVVTSGPEDKNVIAVKQSYDFETAKKRLEERLKEQQKNPAQQTSPAGGGSCN